MCASFRIAFTRRRPAFFLGQPRLRDSAQLHVCLQAAVRQAVLHDQLEVVAETVQIGRHRDLVAFLEKGAFNALGHRFPVQQPQRLRPEVWLWEECLNVASEHLTTGHHNVEIIIRVNLPFWTCTYNPERIGRISVNVWIQPRIERGRFEIWAPPTFFVAGGQQRLESLF